MWCYIFAAGLCCDVIRLGCKVGNSSPFGAVMKNVWSRSCSSSYIWINWCSFNPSKLLSVPPGLILKHNSTFCPTQTVFMCCFVWIWEQTAIISLYSINWLVCITETECVCTECLYCKLLSALNKAVTWLRRLVASLSPRMPGFEATQVNRRYVVDKVALGQDFLKVPLFPYIDIISSCTLILYLLLLSERQADEGWEPF